VGGQTKIFQLQLRRHANQFKDIQKIIKPHSAVKCKASYTAKIQIRYGRPSFEEGGWMY